MSARVDERIAILPLTADAFAPFGEVLEIAGPPDFAFNAGMAQRWAARALPEVTGEGGRVAISLARAEPYRLPLHLDLVERHPLGSQAFMPLSAEPFLVVVAADEGERPGRPRAFLTNGAQGVNYRRNVWHGVLTPLDQPQDFLIVDRTGPGDNLQEHHFARPWLIGADDV